MWYVVIFFICAVAIFGGCGLDEFYVLDAPDNVIHRASITTSDANERYCEFETNETSSTMQQYKSSTAAFRFLGTAVYYKIYNNTDILNKAVTSISSANTSSTYSSAVQILKSRGYQPLGVAEGFRDPLVEATPGTSNARVRIRLTNFQEASSPDTKAQITISGGATATFTPERYYTGSGEGVTFDFGRSGDRNEEPTSGDSSDTDSSIEIFSDGKKYYVDMWAFAVGRDTTYTHYYSRVLHLGTVAIDADREDN